MKNIYEKEMTVLPGACDSSASLGIPETFSLFMDIATEHACALGCGIDSLSPRGLFWLTVRTRVRFIRRPKMLERITVSTWPEQPGKLRADRDYVIMRGDELLVAGKTEWTVLDTESGKLHPMSDVFAPDYAFYPEAVWDEPFTRMTDEPLEDFAQYTVRSTDIDLGSHMNNAAYVRALAGAFSCEQWQGMDIRELEIAYRAPCFEGDTLIWQKKDNEAETSLRAAMENGKTIALARIVKGL
ncbi:MAG: hypothetical protein J5449_12545 [Oscillospiraceae bacterium]|nr:hypothetical protein [Oscillospiraceae bacterium]